MCGITGYTGDKIPGLIKSMTQELVHRGPDDEGYYADARIDLGFRRLSIIDLQSGHQPMQDSSGNLCIVFNGEIYNYKPLKKELEDRGYDFKTTSDTEVIIASYLYFGQDFVTKLDGMFAFALYDKRSQKVILARDRIGKKPLFYFFHNGDLFFASEIKALLKVPHLKRRINFEALHHYLSLKHIPHPMTIFEGVQALAPAHILEYKIREKKSSIRRYWRLEYMPVNKKMDENEVIDEILRLLDRAVNVRLQADVPIGAYLSGGLDSSGIVTLMRKNTDKDIQTFSFGYKENIEDSLFNKGLDVQCAELVAKKSKTIHNLNFLDIKDIRNHATEIIRCFDEPFSGSAAYYFMAQEVHKKVKVILSGDGNDEIFGSYWPHILAEPINYYLSQKDKDSNWKANLLKYGFPDIITPEYISGIAEKNEWDWRIKLNVWTDLEKQGIYSNAHFKKTQDFSTANYYKNEFMRCQSTTPLNRMLEMEIETKFPNEMLMLVDHFNMAHSVECRCPFVDYRLMEYCAKLPDAMKVRASLTKYIYRKSFEKILDPIILKRPKEGQVAPVYDYLDGRWFGWLEKILSRERLAKHGIFDHKKIKEFLDNRGKIKKYHFGQKAWTLAMFQVWFEEYMS